MTELLHAELTKEIIGVYYDVYNGLSRTYPEYIYEAAMMLGLEKEKGIPCVQQDEYEIWYKDRLVGKQRLDIFVAKEVVVENKVAERIQKIHLVQLMSYLKTVGKTVGLLFNFGGPKPEFKRRVLTDSAFQRSTQADGAKVCVAGDDLLHPDLVYDVVGGMLEVFKTLGPGFVHRIYGNACYHELRLRGHEVAAHKSMRVYYRGHDVGGVKFRHLQIASELLVFPVAIGDVADIRLENLKDRMRYLDIPLGILVNFHTTWLQPVILRA